MYRVLIVDDENMERDCIRYLVNKHFPDIEVTEAENGRRAMEVIKEQHIDILITDIHMPFINGLDLLKEVSLMKTGIIPVVYSAFSEFDYARQAMKYGVSNYLLKPLQVEEFREMFSAIIAALEKKRIESSEHEREFLNFDSINGTESVEEFSEARTDEIIKEIYNAVKKLNGTLASKNVDRLFNLLAKTEHMSSLYVKHLCIEIIKTSVGITGFCRTEFLHAIEEIGRSSNVANLKEYIKGLLVKMVSDYGPGSGVSERNVTMEIIKIIKDEYGKCISLEEIAGRVHLSPTYLSALFKKETGVNFVKFLNDYRLEQAKNLLDTTDMKIHDISQAVGFSSDSYFVLQFKKLYGVTPTSYKEGR